MQPPLRANPARKEAMSPVRLRKRMLLVSCIIMCAIGFIYGWSVFSAPLSDEFGWDATTISFTFTVLMWAFCAGGIAGAKLTARTSPRTTLALSAAGIFAAFALTALLVNRDIPWLLYLSYGGLGGSCVGMAYTTTMGTLTPWFPDRTGTVSGLMLLCYGMSTMVLGSVAAGLFASLGWRWSYIVLSACMATLVGTLSLAMRKPTAKEAAALLPPPETSPARACDAPEAKTTPHEYATADMLRQPVFYAYACWMLAVSCIGLGLIGSANQLALDAGAAVPVAVAVVGILSVCNGCGRLVVGILFDRAGIAATMAVVATAHGIGCVFVLAALAGSSIPLMMFGVVVGGLGIGGTSVVGSGFTAQAFGTVHYAENLSVLNLALIPAALLGPLLISSSAIATGSYALGVSGLACLAAAALACAAVTGNRLKARHR